MQFIAGLLILAGLGTGFAYPWYLSARSGKNLGEVTLQTRVRDGDTHFGSIALDPTMNPLELSLTAEVYHARKAREQHTYGVYVKLGGREVHRESVWLTAEEAEPVGQRIDLSNTLGLSSVAAPGNYEFMVYTGREPYPVWNLRLSARGNVEQPKPRLRNIGIGLFIAGCLLALVAGAMSKSDPND